MLASMDMKEHPAVRTTGLRKRFGKVQALDGLDPEIHSGEILGLIGPSGSGKTSFARAVVGLLTPDSCKAEVFGEAMPSRKVLSRVGYMAQADALYDDLDGLGTYRKGR